ncbi:chemotaxis response regulator protein-glutamate methylesterase [Candidimonas sp. SYP-B2681]|uniref:chemotaxis response regulator protein-glutamate methylesterase n=1 Tax=Candidimonas sp. SYP-B2681 TaxID=2497686 RepID=UPI000F872CD4|nr:chemotaxis response regulator protein-glutamate methylesterase [Candidimonas sp. SYP-B2681]RTZ48084.1 chemotaxis response regulator protein-glutamate methylesterase [Candidimonas sp. SYP-B2681]
MKIGIVNDLPLAVETLRRALALRPDHEVIWVAHDGEQAVQLCKAQRPDLVLMDVVMPHLDGGEVTRRIMKQSPCAILIVTLDVGAQARKVYEALGCGAVDAVDTSGLMREDFARGAAPLLSKIEMVKRLIAERQSQGDGTASVPVSTGKGSTRLVAIGASAGGPGALATVLRKLPANFPAAVVVIQHIDAAFAHGMAEWLGQQCSLPVRIASEGDRAVSGTVLVAGTDQHLRLKGAERLGYTPDPAGSPYHPSIDVFFHSVVSMWRGDAVGVLLSGMGRDGASGLKAMRDKGYYTIAQDRSSSAVYGMPKAAAEQGAAVAVVPSELIASKLIIAFA